MLVTAAEAASMLLMGKSTFWREVKNKNVPGPVKIGGLTRWRVADLQRCVDELVPEDGGATLASVGASMDPKVLLRRLDNIT
jgi:predicted DNA-binding transcriptional regulator AlpA